MEFSFQLYCARTGLNFLQPPVAVGPNARMVRWMARMRLDTKCAGWSCVWVTADEVASDGLSRVGGEMVGRNSGDPTGACKCLSGTRKARNFSIGVFAEVTPRLPHSSSLI